MKGKIKGLHFCYLIIIYCLTDTQKTVQPAEIPDRNLPVRIIARDPPLLDRLLPNDSAIQPTRPGIVLSRRAGSRPN